MRQINFEQLQDESTAQAIARGQVSPVIRSAITTDAFTISGMSADISDLVTQLDHLTKGDNFNSDEMLKSQAQTLDAIFNNLAYTATLNFNNMNVFVPLMKLAIQAQNQCGKTLQVIQQSKLLSKDEQNGAKLDDRATIDAIPSNKKMATLEVINGGKNSRRKRESIAKFL